MRAALYARYSTEQQNEDSIRDQFRATERTATAAGLTVVDRFEDAGISGGTTERPGYQSLLAAARRGEFEIIVAEDISRLWRNRAEYGTRSAEFEDLGIHLLTCVGDDTRRDGWGLVLGIKQAIAEQYRREISYRTRRGLEGLALDGKSTGGRTFGFRSDGTIEPEQAKIVRLIFESATAGATLRYIAGLLNQSGTRAPRGGRWSPSTVSAILANERYAGAVRWGATESRGGAADSRHKRRVSRPGGPLVEMEGPAIVRGDVFAQVRERQRKNRLQCTLAV